MTAIITAAFLSFSTLTQQMLCSVGYSDVRITTLVQKYNTQFTTVRQQTIGHL